MTKLKACSKCNKRKEIEKDFYVCAGKSRSECKECTVQRNVRYQRKVKAWKHRYVDDEARKDYMRDYYSKNKEKFKNYRIQFKKRYPDYYREYFRNRKHKDGDRKSPSQR